MMITQKKPAVKWCPGCDRLLEDLGEGFGRGNVRRPVEDVVIRKELRVFRNLYHAWRSKPDGRCFCQFVKQRMRGLRRHGRWWG